MLAATGNSYWDSWIVYVGGTHQIVIQDPWGIPGIEFIKKEILK
jgi:hypothetical protein